MQMKKKLDFSQFILFDGGLGSMLMQQDIKSGEIPDLLNIRHPEVIEKIHSAYLNAGSDVICANTFSANRYKLERTGYSVAEMIHHAVKIAQKAAKEQLVALDIGPTGKLMAPYGDLTFEEAYAVFAEMIQAGVASGVDLILIETMSDLYEAKAAVLAAKENSDLPVICTMTFQKGGRTLMGNDPITVVNVLQSLGVVALGLNCSLGPKDLMPLVETMLQYASVPVIVQPNAGLPHLEEGVATYDISPADFTEVMVQMAQKGVRILGGCCGTTPEYIEAIKTALKDMKPELVHIEPINAVSSATKTVFVKNIILEQNNRISVAKSESLIHALKSGDIGEIVSEIMDQESNDEILRVNLSLPGIDEKSIMIETIKMLQGMVKQPLLIESGDMAVIEAAIRYYNGKPMVVLLK